MCIPRHVTCAYPAYLLISFHIQLLLQRVFCGGDFVFFLHYLNTLS